MRRGGGRGRKSVTRASLLLWFNFMACSKNVPKINKFRGNKKRFLEGEREKDKSGFFGGIEFWISILFVSAHFIICFHSPRVIRFNDFSYNDFVTNDVRSYDILDYCDSTTDVIDKFKKNVNFTNTSLVQWWRHVGTAKLGRKVFTQLLYNYIPT